MNSLVESPEKALSHTHTQCEHCGEPCEGDAIIWEEKAFCCEGCKTVYDILNTHELGNYYSIENRPGIKRTGQGSYAFLEEEQIITQLLDYQDESQVRLRFYLPQMHCASCIWLLEHLYKIDPAILSSRVNFLRKEVLISYDPQAMTLRELAELLASIGYPPEIKLKDLAEKKAKHNTRTFYYQLGIAGFCFGNIMLLSFPEYLSLHVDTQFQVFFQYLNLILALPVFFYCSQAFFKPAYWGLKQGRLNIDVPVSLGILSLFLRSSWEILALGTAGYMDSLAGLVFFLLIGRWFQHKTYDSISFDRDYTAYFPVSARCFRDKQWQNIVLPELEIGDQLGIHNEELIPADAILLSGQAHIDYSFVTGEEKLVAKTAGEKLYAGGRQKGEAIEIVLEKKVSQSYLTELWNDPRFQDQTTKSTQSLIDAFGQHFTRAVIAIALGAAGYWAYAADWGMAAHVFSSVLIVACPCALALASPIILGNAMRILGNQSFFLKNTFVIERLAKISAIVFDKTGTLTRRGRSQDLWQKTSLKEDEKKWIQRVCAQSQHPVSRAIAGGEQRRSLSSLGLTGFEEHTGKGIAAEIAGHRIQVGSLEWVEGAYEDAWSQSHAGAHCAIDGVYRGYITLGRVYRPGLTSLLKRLNTYRLALISGDHDHEEASLRELFGEGIPLLFRASPQDKLNYIDELQREGDQVMMVGDGLNDAGALKKSDVGIAIAEEINNFSPACDGILHAPYLHHLGDIVAYARTCMRWIKWAIAFSLLYNLVGLGIAVQGLLSPLIAAVLMPVSSLSIVAWGLLSTYLSRPRFQVLTEPET